MISAREKIEVCITVDTEFSIGGNFANPQFLPIAEPIVLGQIGGTEHGLGFLLDSFREFGARATFFVETLQTAYFGDEPMGGIARRIAEAGQDVQLHLHPCWLHYETRAGTRTKTAPNDSCAGRSDAELDYFFVFGLSVFSRWGLPAPVAVRSGNFQVDVNFYRAAGRSGISVSSSIALPLYRPRDPELILDAGTHRIGQVSEFPVLCYSYALGHRQWLRPLAITACSSGELLSALWQARYHGISPVIIVTHPFEFIKRKDPRYATLRPNRVNKVRLRKVLQFLQRHNDKFVTVPISEVNEALPSAPSTGGREITVSARQAIARMAENAINDTVWWY